MMKRNSPAGLAALICLLLLPISAYGGMNSADAAPASMTTSTIETAPAGAAALPNATTPAGAVSPTNATTSAGNAAPAQCGSAQDLLRFLTQDAGGEAVLLADIEWTGPGTDDSIFVTRPCTVRTDRYSIHVPENSAFILLGPVRFEKNAPADLAGPLFTAEGDLVLENDVNIHFKGDDSPAIQFHQNTSRWGNELSLTESELYAEGTGCTALQITGGRPLDLNRCRISASGGNSTAIRTEGPVRLELCSVTAGAAAPSGSQGPDCAAVRTASSEITLDSCLVSPLPSGAEITSRQAVSYGRLGENGLCFTAGASRSELDDRLKRFQNVVYVLYDPVDEISSGYLFVETPVSWSGLPDDLDLPGIYSATVHPQAPSWFPAALPPFTVPIRVIDPSRPAISEAVDSGSCASLRFFSELPEPEKIRLLYSADEGPWLDAAGLTQTAVGPSKAIIGPLEKNHTYRFHISVPDSDMDVPAPPASMLTAPGDLTFLLYDLYSLNGGGDRDGDGRDDQGDLPDVEIIPPDPDADDSSRPSGGGSSHRPPHSSGVGSDPAEEQPQAHLDSDPGSDPDSGDGTSPGALSAGPAETPFVTAPGVETPARFSTAPAVADGLSAAGSALTAVQPAEGHELEKPEKPGSGDPPYHGDDKTSAPASGASPEPASTNTAGNAGLFGSRLWPDAFLAAAGAAVLLFCAALILKKKGR